MVSPSPINSLAKFVLYEEQNNRLQMSVWVEINDGCLQISGQDLGVAPLEFWGEDEYEYFYSFSQENTARLVSLLGATSHDFKNVLFERFGSIDGLRALRDFCGSHAITYDFFSC